MSNVRKDYYALIATVQMMRMKQLARRYQRG